MTATIHVGDCLEVMRGMPDASVQCCVTSPPYFGLRDYGHPGQIGMEPTPAAFVEKMVAVFREVRRVLRDDGTLWLNLGDSYAGSWGAQGRQGKTGALAGRSACAERQIASAQKKDSGTGSLSNTPGLKPKDLIGIPWRVAFALQADGWWLRQDIIWHKPNPMPESIRDRCTKAHEYIFLLSKSERYHYDSDGIQEPSLTTWNSAKGFGTDGKKGEGDEMLRTRGYGTKHADVGRDGRNRRSVWTVPSAAFSGAHFATFPPDLIRPCILAGCPADGVVLDPFTGSGTTGVVCVQEGRQFVGIELNPQYAAMARRRITAEAPLFVTAKEAR